MSAAGVVDAGTAAGEAHQAAARAGVTVVEADSEHAARLIAHAGDLVWGPRGTLAPNELRALAFAGNPVHLATDRRHPEQPVVGFALGFLGWSPTLHVHSHQAGVVPGHRRRGIGLALKLAQRRTCLEHEIAEMRWTFDPLVRRNTMFNVTALGARAATFHADFYGAMSDSINAGDASDRIEAVWDLHRPLPTRAGQAASAPTGGAGPALLRARDGRPVTADLSPRSGAVIEVPANYETIRADDPELGQEWRLAMRHVLATAYDAGFRIGAVDEQGYRLVVGEAD